jgi:hypothetical protein
MSWGTQVQFKPSDKLLLNYSTFIGTDKPDSARLMRIYHNVYGIISLSEKVGLTLGFDIGTEEKSVTTRGVNTWFSPVAILRYAINDKVAIAGRLEYYDDENGVIISTGTPNGFKTTGYSANIDYAPMKQVLLRFEARSFQSKDAIFNKQSQFVKQDNFVTGSLAISF